MKWTDCLFFIVITLNIWVLITQFCVQLMHNLQVTGDETQVLQSVLECDTEREKLLEEERKLLALTGHGRYTAWIHKLVVSLQVWSLKYCFQYSNVGGFAKLCATECPFWIIIFDCRNKCQLDESCSLRPDGACTFCLEVSKRLVILWWHINFWWTLEYWC